MSESEETSGGAGGGEQLSGSPHIREVRYSLARMMEEVKAERKNSALGEELVDTTEISKMFKQRKRKRKKPE